MLIGLGSRLILARVVRVSVSVCQFVCICEPHHDVLSRVAV